MPHARRSAAANDMARYRQRAAANAAGRGTPIPGTGVVHYHRDMTGKGWGAEGLRFARAKADKNARHHQHED